MSKDEIRLRILEVILPTASRYGIDNPDGIVNTCRVFENYVVDSQAGEDSPDSPGKRKPGRPRKGQADDDVPAFLDPTHGGQVELAR